MLSMYYLYNLKRLTVVNGFYLFHCFESSFFIFSSGLFFPRVLWAVSWFIGLCYSWFSTLAVSNRLWFLPSNQIYFYSYLSNQLLFLLRHRYLSFILQSFMQLVKFEELNDTSADQSSHQSLCERLISTVYRCPCNKKSYCCCIVWGSNRHP